MLLNTVPVSCKSHRRKVHTLEQENSGETCMDHFWEHREHVLHNPHSVCPIRFEYLIAQFLFCV